mmetsp:Transcript_5081/g.13964  ORF Transcript_5081/g.13964 Transcript_5081/m.13964 type:complete len:284 (+) Transcript_5081:525-1376(+)
MMRHERGRGAAAAGGGPAGTSLPPHRPARPTVRRALAGSRSLRPPGRRSRSADAAAAGAAAVAGVRSPAWVAAGKPPRVLTEVRHCPPQGWQRPARGPRPGSRRAASAPGGPPRRRPAAARARARAGCAGAPCSGGVGEARAVGTHTQVAAREAGEGCRAGPPRPAASAPPRRATTLQRPDAGRAGTGAAAGGRRAAPSHPPMAPAIAHAGAQPCMKEGGWSRRAAARTRWGPARPERAGRTHWTSPRARTPPQRRAAAWAQGGLASRRPRPRALWASSVVCQ